MLLEETCYQIPFFCCSSISATTRLDGSVPCGEVHKSNDLCYIAAR
jgi:hypothetical protein